MAIIAAFVGQYIITKLITISGRASLIIFVLAFTIFISAIALGKIQKIYNFRLLGAALSSFQHGKVIFRS